MIVALFLAFLYVGYSIGIRGERARQRARQLFDRHLVEVNREQDVNDAADMATDGNEREVRL